MGFFLNLKAAKAGGRTTVGPLILLKKLDSLSPILCGKAASGSTFPQGVLTCQEKGKTYLTITLKNGVIVCIDLKNDPDTGVKRQEVSVDFSAIIWKTLEGGAFGWVITADRPL
jgi:type VI protein secretion system component Hcp